MPREHFEEWMEKESAQCGDEDANAELAPLIAEGLKLAPVPVKGADKEKSLKDQMAWTRDQVSDQVTE